MTLGAPHVLQPLTGCQDASSTFNLSAYLKAIPGFGLEQSRTRRHGQTAPPGQQPQQMAPD